MDLKFPNIINKDGLATYFGNILTLEQNATYLTLLLNKIEWEQEQIMMFGKLIVPKRKVAFYADHFLAYTYSNKTKRGLPWTPELIKLKAIVESHTKVTYNACLLNLYHNGEEGMGWHSDDEKEIIPHSSIASLSIGAIRKFSFKHKISHETKSIILENGSLLEMKGALQKNWLHALPKTKKVTAVRINLTFRQMHV